MQMKQINVDVDEVDKADVNAVDEVDKRIR